MSSSIHGVTSTSIASGEAEVSAIRQAISSAATELRRRRPWLCKYQDLLGLVAFFAGVGGTAFNAWAYAAGWMPGWLCVPLTMVWLSLLHELEHDLLHQLFFRRRPWVGHAMLAVAWALRPNGINPWIRRDLHLHHHKMSGTSSDLEEIALGNGEPWGIKRFLIMSDTVLAFLLRPVRMSRSLKVYAQAAGRTERGAKRLERAVKLALFPLGNVFYFFWHGLVLFSLFLVVFSAAGHPFQPGVVQQHWLATLRFCSVVLFIPNVLRTFCLYAVTSNIHYCGDILGGDLLRQTQVWTSPWVLPLNLFCFNFGGTHAIHHFVVREPFYMRQAIATRVYPAMRSNGVRFNDFATIRRANRWN